MTRVVFDTGVLIRYLIRPSTAIRTLIETYWLENRIVMISAPELIGELREVLGRERMRNFIAPEDGQALLDAIQAKAVILPGLGDVPAYTRDIKDDKFVACAIAGNADYLISVDDDILALGDLAGVQMTTPHEFVADR